MSHKRPDQLRVLVDANLLINAMLTPDPSRSAAAAILEEASRGSFILIVSMQTFEEVVRVSAEKPWLAARITPGDLQQFVDSLQAIAETPPTIEARLPRVSRDAGADYLLAEALRSNVDLLITRDRDVLDLEAISGVSIIEPAALLNLLGSAPKS